MRIGREASPACKSELVLTHASWLLIQRATSCAELRSQPLASKVLEVASRRARPGKDAPGGSRMGLPGWLGSESSSNASRVRPLKALSLCTSGSGSRDHGSRLRKCGSPATASTLVPRETAISSRLVRAVNAFSCGSKVAARRCDEKASPRHSDSSRLKRLRAAIAAAGSGTSQNSSCRRLAGLRWPTISATCPSADHSTSAGASGSWPPPPSCLKRAPGPPESKRRHAPQTAQCAAPAAGWTPAAAGWPAAQQSAQCPASARAVLLHRRTPGGASACTQAGWETCGQNR